MPLGLGSFWKTILQPKSSKVKKENFFNIFGEVSKSKIKKLIMRMERLKLDLSTVDERFVKGSGKGGQKRNKTSNKVVLRHIPTGITVSYGRSRSLSLNRFIALRNLVERLEREKNLKGRREMKILEGKSLAQDIHCQTAKIALDFFKKTGRKPSLAIINYYEDSPSAYYMRLKVKKAVELGIDVKVFKPQNIRDKTYFIDLVKKLGLDPTIDAIMVERPLPDGFDDNQFWDILNPSKDVDGLSSVNMGRLFITRDISDVMNYSFFVPQTAFACIKLLQYYSIDVKGKKVCVVGRSSVVGKPLAIMLSLMDATVTLCHSKTEDISWHLKNSDMIFVAVGKARFINKSMISSNQIIVDIGTNIDENERIVGDVDFEDVKDNVLAITPVPGGVGPVTLACLLNAAVRAAQNAII